MSNWSKKRAKETKIINNKCGCGYSKFDKPNTNKVIF